MAPKSTFNLTPWLPWFLALSFARETDVSKNELKREVGHIRECFARLSSDLLLEKGEKY